MPDGPRLKVITTADGKRHRIVVDSRPATTREISQQIPRRRITEEVRARITEKEGRAPQIGQLRERVRTIEEQERARLKKELKERTAEKGLLSKRN